MTATAAAAEVPQESDWAVTGSGPGMAPEMAAGMAAADPGLDWAAEGNRECIFAKGSLA